MGKGRRVVSDRQRKQEIRTSIRKKQEGKSHTSICGRVKGLLHERHRRERLAGEDPKAPAKVGGRGSAHVGRRNVGLPSGYEGPCVANAGGRVASVASACAEGDHPIRPIEEGWEKCRSNRPTQKGSSRIIDVDNCNYQDAFLTVTQRQSPPPAARSWQCTCARLSARESDPAQLRIRTRTRIRYHIDRDPAHCKLTASKCRSGS